MVATGAGAVSPAASFAAWRSLQLPPPVPARGARLSLGAVRSPRSAIGSARVGSARVGSGPAGIPALRAARRASASSSRCFCLAAISSSFLQ